MQNFYKKKKYINRPKYIWKKNKDLQQIDSVEIEKDLFTSFTTKTLYLSP